MTSLLTNSIESGHIPSEKKGYNIVFIKRTLPHKHLKGRYRISMPIWLPMLPS
jgi:hypothetical protein